MKRGYVRTGEAWYKDSITEQEKNCISFGMYDGDGCTTGEMDIQWHTIGNSLVPRLECYDDAWKVLHSFSDVIEKFAEYDNINISMDEFCKLLDECNFTDMTSYTKE